MMNKRSIGVLVLGMSLLVIGYFAFREIFFERTQRVETLSSQERAQLADDHEVSDSELLAVGITAGSVGGSYLISNGQDEFWCSRRPHIIYIDSSYFILANGNWGINDNLLEVVFLPTYSEIVILRCKDLTVQQRVRVSGLVKRALVIRSCLYFSQEHNDIIECFRMGK